MIVDALHRSLDEIAVRERDVMQSFRPGAVPERSDVARTPSAQYTGDPLNVVAPTGSYFVSAADGNGRLLFSRDGGFHLADGRLVDASGDAVLGYAGSAHALVPLKLPVVDLHLGVASDPRIGTDGTLTYARMTIDPRTGKRELSRVAAGRVALARFAPGTKLRAQDATRAVAPTGIEPHLGEPGDGSFGALRPQERERSGVDIDRGLQRLQEAYLAFDALAAAGKAHGAVEKTTMDLLQ